MVLREKDLPQTQRARLAERLQRILEPVGGLLVVAGASYQFQLGERWFGWRAADPTTEPSAVLPPEGLRLPATRSAPG